METKHERDILQDRLASEQFEILKDDADLAPQQRQFRPSKGVDPAPRHPDLPGCRPLGGVEEPQEGGLSGARGTGQKDHLPGIDGEVETAQNLTPVVVLGGAADPNHGL